MTDLELLRHTVATLAYRAGKTMRGAPASFADFKPGPTSKTPVEIVAHMGDLFDWGYTLVTGEWKWNNSTPMAWDQEVARFFAALKKFDDALASLRRLADCPMKGESYARAEIVIGKVGFEQTPANPKYEFD